MAEEVVNTMVDLTTTSQRIRSTRALVLLRNAKGHRFPPIDVQRWVRIARMVHKAQKVDILANGDDVALVPPILEFATRVDMAVSLRTDCAASPTVLEALKTAGLFDVLLTPDRLDSPALDAWLAKCRELDLPVRLLLLPPITGDAHDEAADHLARHGVRVVDVALHDTFLPGRRCADEAAAKSTLLAMNAFAGTLEAHGIEANLVRVPFCLVDEPNRVRTLNTRQLEMDHQHYGADAYEIAFRLFNRTPPIAAKVLLILLGRKASYWNPIIDSRLFPWLLTKSRLNVVLWMLHKMVHHAWPFRRTPKPIEDTPEAWQAKVSEAQQEEAGEIPGPCAECRFRRVCDTETPELKRALPGIAVIPEGGEEVVGALHFCREQRKHYDSIDVERRDMPAGTLELAEKANHIVKSVPPDREIDSFSYEIMGQWTHQMPGGVAWYSYSNTEKLSTVLADLHPPCTVSVTFGGGVADFVGFGFGRNARLLCPMDHNTHRVVLHVAEDGHYAMMRDGVPVRPSEFEAVEFVPRRLAGLVQPRLCIRNIDGSITTQGVFVWEGDKESQEDLSRIKYSFLVVSTRYTRRLQAVLQSIGHQKDIDLSEVEVIVSYVPGIDAVDDLIDGCAYAYPGLRIVRAPFPEQNTKSKGFLINEAVHLASGDWVILLDSDILLAPDMLARLANISDDAHFVACDGRKMLDEPTTGKILLGEIRPWESFEDLLTGPGEFRLREAEGMPIGFFQCVRRECFEKVQYIELDHFEGSDWQFGAMIRKEFGKETRLSGAPVLHLDHGGSQWYGTTKHR
ncbi:MAG: glycosyltransferase family 2 protein [bacterium]|nr:glycosyltransferase family 2 protein [bacterium]